MEIETSWRRIFKFKLKAKETKKIRIDKRVWVPMIEKKMKAGGNHVFLKIMNGQHIATIGIHKWPKGPNSKRSAKR